jgi:hypothetical protein
MTVNLCQFKNIFGEPGKGAHSIRVLDFAIVDIIGTILMAHLLIVYTMYFKDFSLFSLSCILILASVYIHKLFCVETKLTGMWF